MSAYWLTYTPLSPSKPKGWPAQELSKLVERFQADPASATPLWRIASHRAAKIGDRVYVFKQGSGARGIFGVGEIIESPRRQSDPDDIAGGLKYRAKIIFDRLVDPRQEFLLDYESLRSFVPKELFEAYASGNGIPEDVASELERRLFLFHLDVPPIDDAQADDGAFDPDSIHDERERAMRAIRIRRGQPAFRAALLEAYAGRCAITGCAVEAVLEAAHITPYLGERTNHVSNGLLLRSDLHTLFDCELIAIDPKTRTVVIGDELKGSPYAKIFGSVIRSPKNVSEGPSKRNLEKRFLRFERRRGAATT